MAESTLSIGLPELREEVAYFLGYGRNSANWSEGRQAEIDTIIQSGVRRVYYPQPVIDQRNPATMEMLGYEWSWLRPTTTLEIEAAAADYDLPDDFGRLVGAFCYAEDKHLSPVRKTSVGRLLEMRAAASESGAPRYVAIRYKVEDRSSGQRQEALFYPTPDNDWTLHYEYEAYSGALSEDYPYPLGGMKLAELYIESCLAVAESRLTDEIGQHGAQYQLLLADAISRDKKNDAQNYGQMGHIDSATIQFRRGLTGGSYPVTYKDEVY